MSKDIILHGGKGCILSKFNLFFFFLMLGCTSQLSGSEFPRPGIEPRAAAVKVPSPNHWTAREFPWKFNP